MELRPPDEHDDDLESEVVAGEELETEQFDEADEDEDVDRTEEEPEDEEGDTI